ncbi:MAG: 3-deoxy-7-phosphoheptulonate synthase [Bryobacteraceae bacterium]
MVIVMQAGATDEQIEAVIDRMVEMGFDVHRSTGVVHTVLGGVGGKAESDLSVFEVMDGVKEAHRIASPYKLASRSFRPQGTVVRAGPVEIGGRRVALLAGPARVESRDQLERSADLVAQAGACALRAGVYLRGGSPYGAEGPGEKGLILLRQAAERRGLLVVSEVHDHTEIPLIARYADILEVGSRNMQNFHLLDELGKQSKPVLLKRGIAATVEDLLLSAEHILAGGNYDVILSEGGIRTFETYTRYTLDLSAIPVVKKLSHLPILADPCQATGRRDKVPPMARAAVAAGADGLILEVHPDPDHALSEGAQSLGPRQFEELTAQLRQIAPAVGRSI